MLLSGGLIQGVLSPIIGRIYDAVGGCLGIIAVLCAPFVRRLRGNPDRTAVDT
ncbi:hypothetical protein [Amycolatopsis taiwanensis]|uniref:hypothetical protein n=1 Tax=Amycolatopsis taiwanensis TaxID=342230 RepID=UPI0012EC9056|nr:hypothetical protein [Amycolatopsis taiwanensis]